MAAACICATIWTQDYYTELCHPLWDSIWIEYVYVNIFFFSTLITKGLPQLQGLTHHQISGQEYNRKNPSWGLKVQDGCLIIQGSSSGISD